MPSAREAANIQRHDSTSSSGSGSRVEHSAAVSSPAFLTLAPISKQSEQDLSQLRLAPISPKAYPTYMKASPTFTPLSLKRRLSDARDDEEDEETSERRKRVRSTTLSEVEAATEYAVRKSSISSSASRRSRSLSGGRMTNGLEMLLNAAELEKK